MASQVNGWYFSKEDLMKPVKPDGTDYTTSARYRKEMYKFMISIGSILKVPQLTISTAAVYFHRFYARKDFSDFDRHEVALVTFFLATKVEETHTKLRDVITTGWNIRFNEILNVERSEYTPIRDRLLVLERVVLQTISFDLSIEHPYKFVLEQSKQLWGNSDHKEFAQTAWNFVNDSHMSTVCLQFRPSSIASAAIYLASKIHKTKLPDISHKPWWEKLNVNMTELEDIASQILDAFDQPLPPHVQLTTKPNDHEGKHEGRENRTNRSHSNQSNPNCHQRSKHESSQSLVPPPPPSSPPPHPPPPSLSPPPSIVSNQSTKVSHQGLKRSSSYLDPPSPH